MSKKNNTNRSEPSPKETMKAFRIVLMSGLPFPNRYRLSYFQFINQNKLKPGEILEVFRLVSEEDRVWCFKHHINQYKLEPGEILEVFRLVPEKERSQCFDLVVQDKLENGGILELFRLLPVPDRCGCLGFIQQYRLSFEQILETFRLVPEEDRCFCFSDIDLYKSEHILEAFRLVPEENRRYCFNDIDQHGLDSEHILEAFRLVPEKDRPICFKNIILNKLTSDQVSKVFEFIPEFQRLDCYILRLSEMSFSQILLLFNGFSDNMRYIVFGRILNALDNGDIKLYNNQLLKMFKLIPEKNRSFVPNEWLGVFKDVLSKESSKQKPCSHHNVPVPKQISKGLKERDS